MDRAIEQADDEAASKYTVYDMYNDRKITLSERDLEIIRRVQAGAFAHPEFDDTPDYVDYFSSKKEIMPLSAAPEPKRRFLPSKWETMRVMKIVKAIKEGRYKMQDSDETKDTTNDSNSTYLIWNEAEDEILAETKKHQYHLPAPKLPLPGHAESYNPPQEYLLSEEEKKNIAEMDPTDRPYNFIPKGHDCLRHVGGYDNFVKERFERCLDLYLCPRKLKKRLNIDPETLIPKLPHPRELRPFPNTLALQYIGHKKAVRSISVSPDGEYLATASDDGTVRLWEVETCYCRNVWDLKAGPVTKVMWNPDPGHRMIAAVVGKFVFFITTGTGDADSTEITEAQLSSISKKAELDKSTENGDDDNEKGNSNTDKEKLVKWKLVDDDKGQDSSNNWANLLKEKYGYPIGPRLYMEFTDDVKCAAWHYKGDYIVTLTVNNAESKAVAVHQLSKGKTQHPFKKSPGRVQTVCFHPSRPFLIVVTQVHVKLYHLIEQRQMKKLMSNCKWLSSIDVHSSGDHLIVGSYDRRVVWFDLDLSSTPYKTLKFHEKAVRAVKFHRRYPLMASAADDGNVHVFHSMVYHELNRNAMIVPLKVLKGHGVIGGVGVFDTTLISF